MADKVEAGSPAQAPEVQAPQTPTTTKAPSFTEAKERAGARREADLTAIAEPTPPPAAAPEPKKPFDFDTWVREQPPEAMEEGSRRIAQQYDAAVKARFGPEVYALLEEAGNDPKLAKQLSRLSDKELRKFALETAYDVWQPGDPEPGAAGLTRTELPDEVRERMDRLEAFQTNTVNERRQAEYAQTRQTELQALVNSYPELRWERIDDPTGLRVQAIIEQAQKESMIEQRVVTFADVYNRMRTIEGRSAPSAPAIPATSSSTPPSAAAPRTETESRSRMSATLKKAGGLSGLAASIAAARR